MAGHGYGETYALADSTWKDLTQLVCCSLGFGLASMQAVLKLIQGLPHRIGEGHLDCVTQNDSTCNTAQLAEQVTVCRGMTNAQARACNRRLTEVS